MKARAARDIELEEISKPTLDSARAALERKALVYEKLRKGKSGGLSEKQYESLLVDVRVLYSVCCAPLIRPRTPRCSSTRRRWTITSRIVMMWTSR